MKKVPITTVISGWLDTNAQLEKEVSGYDCDSAYVGYMKGFEAGVESQINEDEDSSKCIITKRDIVLGFKDLDAGTCSSLVSGEDCIDMLSSSQEYWFLAGAMWLMNQLNR